LGSVNRHFTGKFFDAELFDEAKLELFAAIVLIT